MADMLRIQREAQDKGYDSAEFFISAPKGIFPAKWVDAYFGSFTIPEIGDGIYSLKGLPTEWEGFWSREDAAEHNECFAETRRFMAMNEAHAKRVEEEEAE